jgi:integrase
LRRTRYQFGSVERKKRATGPDVWAYRYREDGVQRSRILGTIEDFPKRAQAIRAAEVFRLDANPDTPGARGVTFGALLDRYIAEEMPRRFSTSDSYSAWIRAYIRPKWGDYQVNKVKANAVEQWLKSLTLAPKSLNHIRTVMRVVFNCAMRWELYPMEINPMSKVRVAEGNARETKARVLSGPEVKKLIEAIDGEPFKTMAWISVCMGLERSAVAGLRWGDIDFLSGTVTIQRGIVNNHVDKTKNKYRAGRLPLDVSLVEMLKAWKSQSRWKADSDWVWASPYFNGERPYSARHVAEDHFWPAAKKTGLGEKIGWQSFRRTYSSLLRRLGVDIKVQQELMRHADIRTTLQLYTDAFSEDMREAHGRAVTALMVQ